MLSLTESDMKHKLNSLFIYIQYSHDRMVVKFTPTYAIKANHQQSCLSDSHPWCLELIQLYIIRFVSDLQHISAFLFLPI